MAGCAAVGCSNSSAKGFLMKKFPKDPKRRREWASRTKRSNWVPTISAVLCEVHFEPHMWEVTRVDGTRKLKSNAVPTIFSFTDIYPPQKAIKRETLTDVSENFLNNAVPSTSCHTPISFSEVVIADALPPIACEDIKVEPDSENISTSESVAFPENIGIEHSYPNFNCVSVETFISQSSEVPSKQVSDFSSSKNHGSVLHILSDQEKLDLYEKAYRKQRILLQKYKNKLRSADTKIKYLEEKLKHEETTKSGEVLILNTLFAKDQISALKKTIKNKSTKFMKWSDETIIKALQLKIQCGHSGYEELLRQNLPFPSIRTLQRRLLDLKNDSDGILAGTDNP